jgi:hypothetical protein
LRTITGVEANLEVHRYLVFGFGGFDLEAIAGVALRSKPSHLDPPKGLGFVQPSPFLLFSSFSLLFSYLPPLVSLGSRSGLGEGRTIARAAKDAGHGQGKERESLWFHGKKKRKRDLVHGRGKRKLIPIGH